MKARSGELYLAQASCISLRQDLESELFCKIRLSEIFRLEQDYLKMISQLNYFCLLTSINMHLRFKIL